LMAFTPKASHQLYVTEIDTFSHQNPLLLTFD
jgi:hypothetical protein